MKLSASLLVLAFLIIPSVAVPDSIVTGPYNISFDLGLPHDAYKITVVDPKQSETLGGDQKTEYSARIQNKTGVTRIAIINIDEGEIKIKLMGDEMAASMQSYLPTIGFRDVDSSARIIDGNDGGIASGNLVISGINVKAYQASYYPTDNSTAFIMSSYPWDEGTLQLLKTVHIEKTG